MDVLLEIVLDEEHVVSAERCAQNGSFRAVFVDEVMDQWYLVVITKNSELYSAPMMLLFVTIIIAIIVFILISTFYLLGYRSERKNYLRMEEMKESDYAGISSYVPDIENPENEIFGYQEPKVKQRYAELWTKVKAQ